MVKATRSLFGDNCGSDTRRTFSRSSMVNRRSCANANDAHASKLMTDTTKKRFINDLSGFRSSCLGKRAYYRTFAPDWRQSIAIMLGVPPSGGRALVIERRLKAELRTVVRGISKTRGVRLESLAMTGADCTESISVRPVTADDEAILLEIYKSSRGDDLRGLGWAEDRISEFLGMQYEAQQNFYESEYERA